MSIGTYQKVQNSIPSMIVGLRVSFGLGRTRNSEAARPYQKRNSVWAWVKLGPEF